MSDELQVVQYDNGEYVNVNSLLLMLNFSENQIRNIKNNWNNHYILKHGIKFFENSTNGGLQKCYHINISYLVGALLSINNTLLNEYQKQLILKIINDITNSNIIINEYVSPSYIAESHLRDEIYSQGYFNDIKIIDKEVKYDFGRIDLIGIDSNNQKVIIELKKYKDYQDVIKQCLKYKKGFNKIKENVRIIICMYDCTNILKEANKYGFECYNYNRELKLIKI